MKKSTLILIIVLATIASLLLFLGLSKPSPTPPELLPPSPAQLPITPLPNESPSTKIVFSPNLPQLPTTITSYSCQPRYQDDQIVVLGNNLGFDSGPETSASNTTPLYTWSSPQSFLSFQPQYQLLMSAGPTPNQPDSSPEEILFSWLRQAQLYYPEYEYLPLNFPPTATPSLNYQYHLNRTPIQMHSTELWGLHSQVNDSAKPYQVTAYIPPRITPTGEWSLIPLADAHKALAEGAVPLSYSQPLFPTADTFKTDFDLATITSQELIYLFNHQTSELTPAYRFSGIAPVSSAPNHQYFVVYLYPAI